jgi:hypothetical protein
MRHDLQEFVVRRWARALSDQVTGRVAGIFPADEDGTWRCLPVRKFIVVIRNNDLETNFANQLQTRGA